MDSKGYVHTHIRGNIIHNQKVEAAQVPIDRRMGEKNVAWPYSGILFHFKKKENLSQV